MKKISVLLVCALLLSLFAACGSSTTSMSSEDTESETTSTEETVDDASGADTASAAAEEQNTAGTEAEGENTVSSEAEASASLESTASISYPLSVDEGTTLTLWMVMELSTASVYEDFNEHPFVQQVKDATGVTIEIDAQAMATGSEKTQLMLASGDYTDMICALTYSTGLSGALTDDVIVDLLDYDLQSNAPDYYNQLVENDLLKEVTTDDGAMPSVATLNNGSRGPESGIIVHQEMMDELGLSTPVTYDDYEEVLTAMKTAYDLEDTLFMDPSGVISTNNFAVGFGVKLYIDNSETNGGFYVVDGEVKFGYVEDGFEEYVTLMNSWYNNGLINSDFYSAGSDEASENIITQNIAGEVGMFVRFDGLIDLVATLSGEGTSLKALADPVVNEGDEIHLGNADTMANVNNGIVITTECEDPELALQVLNWMYTDEGFMYMNYGIEGETYTLDESGTPTWTEFVTNNPDGINSSTMISDYTGGGVLTMNVDTLQVDTSYSESAAEAPEIWGSNKDGLWELPNSLTFTDDESSTYNTIMSDILTCCQEYLIKFIIGDIPLSEIPDFQQQLWDMGLQEVLDIYSDALARYEAR